MCVCVHHSHRAWLNGLFYYPIQECIFNACLTLTNFMFTEKYSNKMLLLAVNTNVTLLNVQHFFAFKVDCGIHPQNAILFQQQLQYFKP